MSLTREEFYDLPTIKKFDDDFKDKKFDEEMALGLLNEIQIKWCGECKNYVDGKCGCYFPAFKKEMIKKIHEHFNNPPLKFEELKDGMWVWDDEYKAWRQIHTTYHSNLHDVVEFKDGQYPALARKYFFEDDRFYRKQVL